MGETPVSFEPVIDLPFEVLEKPLPTNFLEMCEWTNGHLCSLAELKHNKISPENMLRRIAQLMANYFNDEKVDHVPLYLGVTKMLKNGSTRVRFSERARPDLRFMSKEGRILSPLFLQAYEMYLADHPPPPTTYHRNHYDLLGQNVIEQAFAAERECLDNATIFCVVSECLQKLDKKIHLQKATTQIVRIRYRKLL